MNPTLSTPQRKIIHVDMDAFYASVEILDNPELSGKPVVVGGNPESRSVVCAASYEARKFGIHSAMACSQAKKLCPQVIFISPHFERYTQISHQIHRIFESYTLLIEPLSLDEAWLDVTQNSINCPSATLIAERIRKKITSETGLTASAGVSYNKFLAKIASDENKPDGIFVITPSRAQDFLREIPLKKLPGIGKVTNQKLKELDLEFGRQLLQCSKEFLTHHFGKFGQQLYSLVRGIDNRPVITHRDPKSIGIENTFAEDFYYGEPLKQELDQLIKGLFKRLEKKQQKGRTLTLKVKFADFKQVTRSVTSGDNWLRSETITKAAQTKLYSIGKQFPQKKIRLLGISMSGFQIIKNPFSDNEQLDIFNLL